MIFHLREYGSFVIFLAVETFLAVHGLWFAVLISSAWGPASVLTYLVVRRRVSRRSDE
jgi:hypothetical protein